MSGQSNQIELSTFLINLLLAAVCSFILGRVYVFWGSSLSNRRAFAANFMLLTVTTTFIILVVRSSVALSLGLVGALSIVRFRAAVKEPEELAYLFFAISLGIGLGDNQRLITLLTLLVAIAVMGLLKVFRNTRADVNLHLTISSKAPDKMDLDQITNILEKHCSKIKLLRFDETADVLESSFVIEFKRLSDLNQAKPNFNPFRLQCKSPSWIIKVSGNHGRRYTRSYRYERKFLVEHMGHHHAIALIKQHPYLFYQPYPPRFINNFYLDTPEMDNYDDNVSGAADRRKVRLRWYGDLFGESINPS